MPFLTRTVVYKMTVGEMKVFSTLNFDSSYKLIPLSSDLLETMMKREQLLIKSASDELVVTSSSKTFQLRQKNHSNTQMLVRKLMDNDLVAFASFNNELELKPVKGSINYVDVPIYNGDMKKLIEDDVGSVSVEQLLTNSPISNAEFFEQWQSINGSEVNGRAVILSQDFVTEVLSLLINTILANGMDPAGILNITEVYRKIDDEDNTITLDIIHTVLSRFSIDSTHKDIDFKLDLDRICGWYGVHSLKLFAANANIAIDEFLIKWRSTLPSALSASLDLSNLKGNYYTPYPNLVRYINKHTLPSDPMSRFKNLFMLQKVWPLDDIVPFIEDLNVKNLKSTSFIMKYARVKKQSGTQIVTSR